MRPTHRKPSYPEHKFIGFKETVLTLIIFSILSLSAKVKLPIFFSFVKNVTLDSEFIFLFSTLCWFVTIVLWKATFDDALLVSIITLTICATTFISLYWIFNTLLGIFGCYLVSFSKHFLYNFYLSNETHSKFSTVLLGCKILSAAVSTFSYVTIINKNSHNPIFHERFFESSLALFYVILLAVTKGIAGY